LFPVSIAPAKASAVPVAAPAPQKIKFASRKISQQDILIFSHKLLTLMRAPKSYTREDIVEINCHGGMQAVKKIFDIIVKCGARIAEPGEFTKRAFLNGRIDLAQAEVGLRCM